MKEKLTSRKLWMAVGMILAIIGTAISGELVWGEAIEAAIKVAMAYMMGQGVADAGAAALPALTKAIKKDE